MVPSPVAESPILIAARPERPRPADLDRQTSPPGETRQDQFEFYRDGGISLQLTRIIQARRASEENEGNSFACASGFIARKE